MLDDEFDIMSIFIQALEQQGFHVIGFTEPLLVQDLKNSYLYWRVVSDIMMPLMDGYQFIKKVKEARADVKVFFMSAYLSDDIQFRTGPALVKVDEYIEKLLSISHFVSLVKPFTITS